MKKIMVILLVFVTMLSFAVPSLALNSNLSKVVDPRVPLGDPDQVTEILYENYTRANPGEPTIFHNLSVSPYSATGTFQQRLGRV